MSLVTVRLKEHFKGHGCPVCSVLKEFEKREMENILYEHVNSPHVRAEIRKSLGLCPYHAWALFETAYSNPLLGPLGISVIYDDMLSTFIRSIEQEADLDGECLICRHSLEREKDVVDEIASHPEEFTRIYRESPAIFCKRHYGLIVKALKERGIDTSELKEVHLKKLRSLERALSEFIDSYDYRSKDTGKNAWALPETIEALKGKRTAVSLGDGRCSALKKRRLLKFL